MNKRLPALDFRFLCIAILLYAMCICTSVVAQDNRITVSNNTRVQDSLELKMLFAEFDTVRQHDRAKAMNLLKTAFAKAKAKGFPRAAYIALSDMAIEAREMGDYQRSIAYLKLAEPYLAYPVNKQYGDFVYSEFGQAYAALGKYDLALNYYYKSLAALKGVGKRQEVRDSTDVYNHIAITWAVLGEYNYALKTFRQAEAIASHKNDSEILGMLYLNIGDVYFRLKNYKDAEVYYNKVLSVSEKKYPGLYMGGIDGMATIYEINKDYDKALEYAHKALEISKTIRFDAYSDIGVNAILGSVYHQRKDYVKAQPILQQAFNRAAAINNKELIETIEPSLAKTYAGLGQYKNAYDHILHYSELKDSLFKQEKSRALEIFMNAQLAEKDKAVLEQKLFIERQQSQLQRKNIWIWVAIVGFIILAFVIMVLRRNYRHKQAIQQSRISQLQQSQEINQLKAQVRGEEQERQRIAHELHDNIASQLWAIKLNMENLNMDDGKRTYVLHQLTDAARDVRKTAHNLMPDLLLEEGLATAIASVCEKTRLNTGLDVDFQEYGVVPRLDKEIELSIYRMVQELIQNVLKHAAEATALLVQLSCADMMLNITVEDNGRVPKENINKEGVGLQQIKKRVAALKGHFDLQIVQGKGTTAYLEFDLQHLL